MFRIVAALVLALGALASQAPRTHADDAITVIEETQRNEWPNAVVFLVKAKAPAQITRIRLDYTFGGGYVSSYGNPKFDAGTEVSGEFSLKTGGSSYVPPGAEITYRYTFEDAAGNSLKTEPKKFVYLDTRFKWESVTEGLVTVYFHDARESNVRLVQKAAADTIKNVGQKAGVQLVSPITVVAYNSVRELDAAISFSSNATRDTVAGQAHSSYNVVHVAADSQEAVRNTMHEITHLITHEATDNPYVELPTWLNEGLSTYFQDNQGSEWNDSLRQAIRSDRLLTLRQLSGRPGKVEENILVYAEGGSVVKFMIEKYGSAKMAQLLAVYKEGTPTKDTFPKVYGKDLDDIENEWRASIGAKPLSGGSSTAPAQPTTPPRTNPAPGPTPPAPSTAPSAGASDTSSKLISALPILAGGAALVVLALAGIVTFAVMRRRDDF